MKNSKHTPGPWIVDRLTRRGQTGNNYAHWIQNAEGEDGQRIAIVESNWTPEREDSTAEANARLIASAPDLLRVVEAVAQGMGNLPLDQIGDAGVHGINDGKSRAIYLEGFVDMARKTLTKLSAV